MSTASEHWMFSATAFAYSDDPAETTQEQTEEAAPTSESESQPEPEKEPNLLPAILTIVLLAARGGFFVFKKLKGKKVEKEPEKPDPDADYVDEEDYGYEESDDYSADEDDAEYSNVDEEDNNEPV